MRSRPLIVSPVPPPGTGACGEFRLHDARNRSATTAGTRRDMAKMITSRTMLRCPAILACLVTLVAPGSGEAQFRAHTFASGFTQPLAFVQDPTDRSVF